MLLGALSLVVLVVGAYLLRGPLFGRPLGNLVAAKLSETFGGRFTAKGVRGAWFSDAVLVDLRTEEAPETGPLSHLSWDRLEVTYGIVDLLRSRPLSGLHSLRIEGLDLRIDLTRPAAAAAPAVRKAPKPSMFARLPARLPAIELRGRVSVRLPLPGGESGTFALEGFSLVSDGRDAADLSLASLACPELGIAEQAVHMRVSRDGDAFTIEGDRGEGTIAGIDLRSLVLDGLGRAPRLRARIGIAGGEVTADLSRSHVSAEIDGVDLRTVPPWLARLVETPSRGTVSGSLDARMDGDDAAWRAEGSIRLRGSVWRGFDIETLEASGSWSPAGLALAHLDLASSVVQAEITDLILDPRAGWMPSGVRRLRLSVPDASGAAAGLGLEVPAALRGRGALAITVAADGDGGTVLTAFSASVLGDGVAAHVDGSGTLPPSLSRWREATLSASWSIDLADKALPGLGDGWGGTCSGRGRVEGTLGDPHAAATLDGHDLRLAGRAISELDVSGSLAWPNLVLEHARVRAAAGAISASGAVDVVVRTAEQLRVEFDVLDLAEAARLAGSPIAMSGAAHGVILAGGTFSGGMKQIMRDAHAYVEVSASELRIAGHVLGGLEAKAGLGDGGLSIHRLELDGPVRLDLLGEVSLDDDGGVAARISRLALSQAGNDHASLRLRETTTVSHIPGPGPFGHWRIDPCTIETEGGRLELACDLGERIDLTVSGINVHPGAFAPVGFPKVEGRASFSLAMNGPAATPEGSLRLRTLGLRIADRDAELSIDALQDAEGLRLGRCDARLDHVLDVSVTGSLPVRLGMTGAVPGAGHPRMHARAFAAVLPGLAPARFHLPETGCIGVTADLDETGAKIDLAIRELLVRIAPLAEDLKSQPDEIAEIDVHMRADLRGWRSSIRARDSGGLAIASDVGGVAAFDPDRPLAFIESLTSDELSGDVTVGNVQLARASVLLPALVRLSGSMSGTLQVSGRPFMPRWGGTLVLDDVGLKVRSDLPAISEGKGRLRLEGTRVLVDELTARMGFEPITVTGTVDVGEWSRPAFDLFLNGQNVLLTRNQYLRLRADCDLHLHGPIEAMTLSGSMRPTDALYSKPIELLSRIRPSGGHRAKDDGITLFSLRDPPLSTLAFDIEIHGLDCLRIHNNIFRGICSLDAHLGGSGEAPIPRGRVWCEEARLKMPFTTIHITNATLVFPVDTPYNPRLEADGEARLKNYDLRVHAAGDLPDVEVTVDSDPPLSSSEGVLLLTTGLTGREREEQGSGRTELTIVGKYLAKEVWHEFFGPGDPDKEPGLLDLDRLDISVGQQLSTTGQETIDTEYELSRHYFLHGERDRFDGYDLGLVWRLSFH